MTNKRLFIVALAALILISALGLASADTFKTVVLTVPELCASNMHTAVSALEALDGVDSVETDMDNTTVTVTYTEYEASPDDFRRAIEGTGLEVTEVVEK